MTGRQRVRAIIAGEVPDRPGFWLGNPKEETWEIYLRHFGAESREEVRRQLGDDLRWICPQFYASTYAHPDGRPMFDLGVVKERHGQPGPFAGCEDPAAVDDYEWPDPGYLDFDDCLADLRRAGDIYRASGFWTPFYHNVMNLFGMEDYLVKMYTHPEVVRAVTDRVCEFYYEANERFFAAARVEVDGFFFGNDFGTQLDLICGPEQFDEFIMPWFRRFTEQGHRHNLQVILHSCGSIYKVIGRLIDAGVDCLHPLQALAANMDAGTLSRDFHGRVAFMGGIDTQELLVNGSPAEVAHEVLRVRSLLEPGLIVSPSHEALLPNVPPENVAAMAQAARA
jgi:uroporphyrinogen decarboxylase